jgi:hypothetical protein
MQINEVSALNADSQMRTTGLVARSVWQSHKPHRRADLFLPVGCKKTRELFCSERNITPFVNAEIDFRTQIQSNSQSGIAEQFTGYSLRVYRT